MSFLAGLFCGILVGLWLAAIALANEKEKEKTKKG